MGAWNAKGKGAPLSVTDKERPALPSKVGSAEDGKERPLSFQMRECLMETERNAHPTELDPIRIGITHGRGECDRSLVLHLNGFPVLGGTRPDPLEFARVASARRLEVESWTQIASVADWILGVCDSSATYEAGIAWLGKMIEHPNLDLHAQVFDRPRFVNPETNVLLSAYPSSLAITAFLYRIQQSENILAEAAKNNPDSSPTQAVLVNRLVRRIVDSERGCNLARLFQQAIDLAVEEHPQLEDGRFPPYFFAFVTGILQRLQLVGGQVAEAMRVDAAFQLSPSQDDHQTVAVVARPKMQADVSQLSPSQGDHQTVAVVAWPKMQADVSSVGPIEWPKVQGDVSLTETLDDQVWTRMQSIEEIPAKLNEMLMRQRAFPLYDIAGALAPIRGQICFPQHDSKLINLAHALGQPIIDLRNEFERARAHAVHLRMILIDRLCFSDLLKPLAAIIVSFLTHVHVPRPSFVHSLFVQCL